MNYRRTRVSVDGRPNVSNDFCHRLPQNEPQFRFNPLLHYQTLQRPYMLNNSLPSTTTTFANQSARLLEWMTRIAPVSTHIPPISLVYSSPVIVDVPSDSVPLDLTMSRHSHCMPRRSLCEAAIDMSFVADRGISSMQHGENLSSVPQRSWTSEAMMMEILPSGGSEEFIPPAKGKKSRGSKCGGNARTGRKRGSKNKQKAPQTTLAGSCLSPTRTMEAVAGLLMLPESSSPGSTAASGGAGEASTPKRPKTPRKSRKPTNYRPIDYLTQPGNRAEAAAAPAAADFAVDRTFGHAAAGPEGETSSSGTAAVVTFESTLSQFCRLLESDCCSATSAGSVSVQNSAPVASCATVTATETQTSPARGNSARPPVPLGAERSPRSSESKATETLVSTAENGCQTDDDLLAVRPDPSLSNAWIAKETEVVCASGLPTSPLPVDVDLNGDFGPMLPSLDLPQMRDLIRRLQRRVQMLEQQQAVGDDVHLLLPSSDSFGSSEPLFDSTAVVASSGDPRRSTPHELSESEESLHLRLSESDDFVDSEHQQLLDSCRRSPDRPPSAVDSAAAAAPVDAGEKSRDFALSGKIDDLKRRLKAIENKLVVSAETCGEERNNSDDVFRGDLDSAGSDETDGDGVSVAPCRHDSEKQNPSTMSHLTEHVVCAEEKSDAGMMMMMMTIRPLEADDYEFLGSATAATPQQSSELSTVMDRMASLDIAEGNRVLSNYQSRLQLEAISPPSSVVSLRDDETGDMDLNLEIDNTFIVRESESETNELLEGISNVVNDDDDDRSGQSDCREIASITLSNPVAGQSFSDSILLLSRVTCAVSDATHLGNIVSAESNTSDNASDGASVVGSSSSSLIVDAFDNTSAYIGTCDVSDTAPDGVSRTDADVPDEVSQIDDRSHEMQVEVDDTQDEGTEQRDSAAERKKPTDANTEDELPFSCAQSVALLSDGLEFGAGATETAHAADDATDRLAVETFSEEVEVYVNRPPLSGHHKEEERAVCDFSLSGAHRTLFDARVVIERLDLDAILEMRTKVRDYKPVVAQWLHKPRGPRHRCRKTKGKGQPVHRPLHCDHNYVVQTALDGRSTTPDSRDVPRHILQYVDDVSEQHSNDMSTSVEPHDVKPHDDTPHDDTPHDVMPYDVTHCDVMLHDDTPHDDTPHDVEFVTTLPLSFNSGLCGTHVDYFVAAISSGSDLERVPPRMHQDDSADDADAEVEISFTSNDEVFPEEYSERDYECTDSYSARCSESTVAMAVVDGVAVSVDDGRQALQCDAGATFGNCARSVLDILETDAGALDGDCLVGPSTVFVCPDEPGTSNVPRATDRGINKAVKNLRTISQIVKRLSTTRGGESGACEMATHFPSYLEDKKASKDARFRRLPVRSLVFGERGTGEDLPSVAGPDGEDTALENNDGNEVRRDGSGAVLLPGKPGNVGCLERRTGEAQNSDWPGEETDAAVGGNPSAAAAAADGEQSNTSDHPDHISSVDRLADDGIEVAASQNAPRKRGRKRKASSQSRPVSNDDCKDKAFDERRGEDGGGVPASEGIQRKRRGRPPRSSGDAQSSTRPEKTAKHDDASQAVETGEDITTTTTTPTPVFLLVKGHRMPKHGRNLFSEIGPSNVAEKSSPSSVCFDFSLLRSSSEAEERRETKRPIGGRTGRPPKRRQRRSGGDDQDARQQQQCSPPRKKTTSENASKAPEVSCRRKHKTKDGFAESRRRASSNESGNDDLRYTRPEIPLLKTVNSTGEVVIRKMPMDICGGKASMIVDVVSKAPSSGVAPRLAQCLFCEFLAPSVQGVGRHLDDCHSEFALVISKVRTSRESATRYFCRRCQFVTVDQTVVWIHFEISHGVRGILTSEKNRVDPVVLGCGQEPEVVRPTLSLDLPVHFDRVYMCPECGDLIEDRRTMVSHVVRCHTTTENNYCNGNFVKSIALTKPRNLPPEEEEQQPTYRSLVMDDAFGAYRKPCYICVFCQFVVFEARLALSHFICFHVRKRLLMVCMEDSCGQRFVRERRFYEHVKQRHGGLDLGAYFDCSVTLLEEDSGEIAEVALPSALNGQ